MQIQLTGFATAPVDGVVTFLKPGLVYDVDDAYAVRLVASGVAVDMESDAPAAIAEAEVSEEEAEVAEVEAESTDGGEADSEEEAPNGPARPAKSDPVAKWQEYVRAQGIDPKGMTKQELIAKFS